MLREESFEHQNRTCYRRELEGCPVVMIDSSAFRDCKALTIHAPAGSCAEQYAKEHNIPFQPIEE